MPTFLSTAFVQQCFEMHRLDLVVKQIKGSGIVVFCRSCRIRHTLRVHSWNEGGAAVQGEGAVFSDALIQCAGNHLPAIGVHAVDVVRAYLDLVCSQCRTTHPFQIVECVTRSSGG